MSGFLHRIFGHLPALRRAAESNEQLQSQNDALERELAIYKTWVPPGHFYSPLHDLRIIRSREQELFGARPRQFAGIDLNLEAQWRWLEKVEATYGSMPWGETPQPPLRYHFGLNQYHYMDAITYWGMLAALRPRRVIEVGVGHSTLALLDANDRLFAGGLEIDLIDPYPDLLKHLLSSTEHGRLPLRQEPVQGTPLELFSKLEANDILFIDSTHVCKAGSDVNHLFFELLPRLAPGVAIQIHDIFYPFEYPAENIYYGIAWQELYLLRAFLQFNHEFEIVLWPSYLVELDRARFEKNMPLTLKNCGGSVWLRRKTR